jgi:hypothetical protein
MTARAVALAVLTSVMFAPAVAHAQDQAVPRNTPKNTAGSAGTNTKSTVDVRELSTDRPDLTESPFTVPKGWWQIESDGINFSTTKRDGETTRVTQISSFNVKYGVRDNVDVQFIFSPYQREEVRSAVGGRAATTGAGDITARLKINFTGNDDGRVAIGLMPFVSFVPDGSRRKAAGGVIFPVAISLAEGWDLGQMLEADIDPTETGHQFTAVHTVTVGHDLGHNVGMYVELFNAVTPRAAASERYTSSFDIGSTYTIGRSIQLDAGVNLGLTRAAADVNVFAGWSIRF